MPQAQTHRCHTGATRAVFVVSVVVAVSAVGVSAGLSGMTCADFGAVPLNSNINSHQDSIYNTLVMSSLGSYALGVGREKEDPVFYLAPVTKRQGCIEAYQGLGQLSTTGGTNGGDGSSARLSNLLLFAQNKGFEMHFSDGGTVDKVIVDLADYADVDGFHKHADISKYGMRSTTYDAAGSEIATKDHTISGGGLDSCDGHQRITITGTGINKVKLEFFTTLTSGTTKMEVIENNFMWSRVCFNRESDPTLSAQAHGCDYLGASKICYVRNDQSSTDATGTFSAHFNYCRARGLEMPHPQSNAQFHETALNGANVFLPRTDVSYDGVYEWASSALTSKSTTYIDGKLSSALTTGAEAYARLSRTSADVSHVAASSTGTFVCVHTVTEQQLFETYIPGITAFNSGDHTSSFAGYPSGRTVAGHSSINSLGAGRQLLEVVNATYDRGVEVKLSSTTGTGTFSAKLVCNGNYDGATSIASSTASLSAVTPADDGTFYSSTGILRVADEVLRQACHEVWFKFLSSDMLSSSRVKDRSSPTNHGTYSAKGFSRIDGTAGDGRGVFTLNNPTRLSGGGIQRDSFPDGEHGSITVSDVTLPVGEVAGYAMVRWFDTYAGTFDWTVNMTIFAIYDATHSNYLRVDLQNGTLAATARAGGGEVLYLVSDSGVNATRYEPILWHGVTASVDSTGTVRVWRNETLLSSGSIGSNFTVSSGYTLVVGSAGALSNDPNKRDNYLEGEMETFRLFRSALVRPHMEEMPIPGNGEITGPEVCDDGNKISGDGCAYPDSTVEDGFTCELEPSLCGKVVAVTPKAWNSTGGHPANITFVATPADINNVLGGMGEEHGRVIMGSGSRCVGNSSFVPAPEVHAYGVHWMCSEVPALLRGKHSSVIEVNGRRNLTLTVESIPIPVVRGVVPSEGYNTGGQWVGILGDGFGLTSDTIPDTIVVGSLCAKTIWSNESFVMCKLAEHTGTGSVDVTVTSTAGSSTLKDAFVFTNKPSETTDQAFSLAIKSDKADNAHDVSASSSGVMVVGDTEGGIGVSNGVSASFGGKDMWASRLALDGTAEWTMQFGSTGADGMLGVAIIMDGSTISGSLVVGYASAPLTHDATSQTPQGGSDAVVMRLAADGSVEWTVMFGTASDDRAVTISKAELDDAVYVAGYTTAQSMDDDGTTKYGMEDWFLSRFTMSGTREWTRQYGSTDDDQPTKMTTFGSDVFVCGYAKFKFGGSGGRGVLSFTGAKGNAKEAVYTSTTSTGTNTWMVQLGIGSNNYCNGMAVDQTTVYVLSQIEVTSAYQYRLARLARGSGAVTGILAISTKTDVVASAVLVDQAAVYVLGTVKAPMDSAGATTYSGAGRDTWVAQYYKDTPLKEFSWVFQRANTPASDQVVATGFSHSGSMLLVAQTAPSTAGDLDTEVFSIPLNSPGTQVVTYNTSSPCLPGTYAPNYGSPLCAECPAGHISTGSGATTCSACPAGSYQPLMGKSSCLPCPRGTYSAHTGTIECLVAEVSSYVDSEGQTAASHCPSGAETNHRGAMNITVCTPCKAGSFRSSSASLERCSLCPKGTFSLDGAATCIQCTAGSYQPLEGQSECLPCPPGQSHANIGATSSSVCQWCGLGRNRNNATNLCEECPTGTYQPAEEGGISCIPCAAGSVSSNSGSIVCSKCSTGEYQDLIGQTTCKECPEHHYGPSRGASQCHPCPLGSSSPKGSISHTQCRCAPGEFGNPHKGAPCVTCPASDVKTSCSGEDAFPQPLSGFWMTEDEYEFLNLTVEIFEPSAVTTHPRQMIMSTPSVVADADDMRPMALDGVISPTVYTCMPEEACDSGSCRAPQYDRGDRACNKCAAGYYRTGGLCKECQYGGEVLDSYDVILRFFGSVALAMAAMILTRVCGPALRLSSMKKIEVVIRDINDEEEERSLRITVNPWLSMAAVRDIIGIRAGKELLENPMLARNKKGKIIDIAEESHVGGSTVNEFEKVILIIAGEEEEEQSPLGYIGDAAAEIGKQLGLEGKLDMKMDSLKVRRSLKVKRFSTKFGDINITMNKFNPPRLPRLGACGWFCNHGENIARQAKDLVVASLTSLTPALQRVLKLFQRLSSIVLLGSVSLSGMGDVIAPLSFLSSLSSLNLFDLLQTECSLNDENAYVIRYHLRVVLLLAIPGTMFVVGSIMLSVSWILASTLRPCEQICSRVNLIVRNCCAVALKDTFFFLGLFHVAILLVVLEPFVCFNRDASNYFLIAEPSVQCFSTSGQWPRVLPMSLVCGIVFVIGTPLTYFLLAYFRPVKRNIDVSPSEKKAVERHNEFVMWYNRSFGFVWGKYQPNAPYYTTVQLTIETAFVMGTTLSFLSTWDQIGAMVYTTFAGLVMHTWLHPNKEWIDNALMALNELVVFIMLLWWIFQEGASISDTAVAMASVMSQFAVVFSIVVNILLGIRPMIQWCLNRLASILSMFRCCRRCARIIRTSEGDGDDDDDDEDDDDEQEEGEEPVDGSDLGSVLADNPGELDIMTDEDEPGPSSKDSVQRHWFSRFTSVLQKTIKLFQFAFVVFNVKTEWPEILSSLSSSVSVMSLDISDMMNSSCAGSTSSDDVYSSLYYQRLLVPAAIMISIGISLLFTKIIDRCNPRVLRCVRYSTKHCKSAGPGIYDATRIAMKAYSYSRDTLVAWMLTVASIYYISMHVTVMELYTCFERESGMYHLAAEPSIQCFVSDGVWITLVPISIMGALAFSIALPMTLVTIILFQHRRRHVPGVNTRYSLLWSTYRDNVYWWEIVVLMFKFVVALGLLLAASAAGDQLMFMLFVMVCFMIGQLWTLPQRYIDDQRMECWLLVSVVTTVVAGLMYDAGDAGGMTSVGKQTLQWGVLLVYGMCLYVFIAALTARWRLAKRVIRKALTYACCCKGKNSSRRSKRVGHPSKTKQLSDSARHLTSDHGSAHTADDSSEPDMMRPGSINALAL